MAAEDMYKTLQMVVNDPLAYSYDIKIVDDNELDDKKLNRFEGKNLAKILKDHKQDKLISGTNIKTINGESLLGKGNIQLQTELPVASTSKLGVVKIGKNLNITEDGTLSAGANLESVTYSELVSLRNNKQLVPGRKYCITDYKTTATGTSISTAEGTQNKFNIIVGAISSNKLSEEAELNSDPVSYYNDSDIDSWKDCNPDGGRTFPSAFPDNMGHEYSSKSGLRPGQVLRIKYVGTTSLGTPIKGWGADLTVKGSNTVLVATFTADTYHEADSQGYFYLTLPPNINPDTTYSVHFFAEYTSNLSELNLGKCGVTIDIINPVSSWEVKYCLDNDTNRFAWADTTNGKGVIYYMKDNLGNEAPYDFKNILFSGKYTFNVITNNKTFDASVATSNCKNNIIEEYVVNGIMYLPGNVFELGSYSSVCWDNVFKGNSFKNTLKGDICNYEISSEVTGANLTCAVSTKNNSKIYTKTIVEKDSNGSPINYKLQKELISGTNIKTVNGKSILGSGNINTTATDVSFDNSKVQINSANVQGALVELSEYVNKNINKTRKVTYQELVELKTNDSLVPGEKYRITDYETTVDPGYFNTITVVQNKYGEGNPPETNRFDVIVEAMNSRDLFENAQVCHCHTSLFNDSVTELPLFNHPTLNRTEWDKSKYDPGYSDSQVIPEILKNKYKGQRIRIAIWSRNVPAGQHYRMLAQPANNYTGDSKLLHIAGIDLIDQETKKVYAADYGEFEVFENSSIEYAYLLSPKISTDTNSVFRVFILDDPEITGELTAKIQVEPYAPYFKYNELYSWEIKYCLDNDTSRFAWADTTNGKGVIYYMKDENGNEASYDFKNILINGKYTFNYIIGDKNYDGSTNNNSKYCYGNSISSSYNSSGALEINRIQFLNEAWTDECHSNKFIEGCLGLTFSKGCFGFNFLEKKSYTNYTSSSTKIVGAGSGTLPIATSSTLGGVMVGNKGFSYNSSSGYLELGTATTTSLGGVKIGAGLSVNNGTISIPKQNAISTNPKTTETYIDPSNGVTLIQSLKLQSNNYIVANTAGFTDSNIYLDARELNYYSENNEYNECKIFWNNTSGLSLTIGTAGLRDNFKSQGYSNLDSESIACDLVDNNVFITPQPITKTNTSGSRIEITIKSYGESSQTADQYITDSGTTSGYIIGTGLAHKHYITWQKLS